MGHEAGTLLFQLMQGNLINFVHNFDIINDLDFMYDSSMLRFRLVLTLALIPRRRPIVVEFTLSLLIM